MRFSPRKEARLTSIIAELKNYKKHLKRKTGQSDQNGTMSQSEEEDCQSDAEMAETATESADTEVERLTAASGVVDKTKTAVESKTGKEWVANNRTLV